MGRLNAIDFSFDLTTPYNFWTGIIGGLLVALSYFGTDQSQVQRYLSGRSITASRLGLLFNGLFKVPMQFLILLCGVMVFVLYQFQAPPAFFNHATLERVRATPAAAALADLERAHQDAFQRKRVAIDRLDATIGGGAIAEANAEDGLRAAQAASDGVRRQVKQLVARALPGADTRDADYVFISFVMANLPRGLVGLLLAVVFCAAMSSTASELTALSQTTLVDFYRRSLRREASDAHYLRVAKLFTAGWGVLAILFATFASLVDNLIQAVNILGSLFYGTILGMFLVAFFLRRVRATPVFVAAILSELVVFVLWLATNVGFLWFNLIGCVAVLLLSSVLSAGGRRAAA